MSTFLGRARGKEQEFHPLCNLIFGFPGRHIGGSDEKRSVARYISTKDLAIRHIEKEHAIEFLKTRTVTCTWLTWLCELLSHLLGVFLK